MDKYKRHNFGNIKVREGDQGIFYKWTSGANTDKEHKVTNSSDDFDPAFQALLKGKKISKEEYDRAE